MFQTVWVIIGCLIGAGFASGKEIYLFFYQYGEIGILGIGIAAFLFFYVMLKCFRVIDWKKNQNKEIRNYKEFLQEIFPSKNRKIIDGLNSFINLFILIEFFIMVSGFGAYMNQEFQIPTFIGASIISFCTYITCKRSMKGIEKANQIVIPLLILCMIHMGVKNVDNGMQFSGFFGNSLGENSNFIQMVIYAILYASYNCILLIPVLIGLKKDKEKNRNFRVALLSAWLVAILAVCIFRILSIGTIEDYQNDIPVVRIARYYGSWYQTIYGLMIGISIYTSAIAICYSLLENLPVLQGKSYNLVLKIVCISSVFVSFIGFSNLVEKLYPLLGVFGIVQIVNLIRYKCKETIEKKAKIV